jgi:hypothetical protein
MNPNTPVTSEELTTPTPTTTEVKPSFGDSFSKGFASLKSAGSKVLAIASKNIVMTVIGLFVLGAIITNPGVPTLAEAPGFTAQIDDRNILVVSWDYLVGNPTPAAINEAAKQTKLDGNDAILFSLYRYEGKTYLAALGSRSVWSW